MIFCFFFTQKKLKHHFLNDHKIEIYQDFQKTGKYVVELTVFNQFAKLQLDTIIFDPQKGCFVFPIVANDGWRHTFKCGFIVLARVQEI